MRKILFNIHLYTSLISCVILLIVCLSGCLLVFEVPMDRWLDPKVSFVDVRNESVPFAQLMTTLHNRFPKQPITEMDLAGPGTSVIAKLSGDLRVFLNPYTGEIIGTRQGQPPSYQLRHLHRELMGGNVGAQIVRITTFLLILQSLTGLYLWWPLKRMKVNWGAPWQRINFDMHHAVGFFTSAFVCIIAVTGLIKAYGDDLQPFFNRVTGEPATTRALLSTPPPGGNTASIPMDVAIAEAKTQLPGAAIARITPPKVKNGSILITMKYPDDSTAPGRSWVVVDQYSGRVLGSQDARTAPAGAQIPIVNRAIHVGGIYGVPTRILAFLASFAVVLQLITGLVMWWRKRARNRPKPRTSSPTPVSSVEPPVLAGHTTDRF